VLDWVYTSVGWVQSFKGNNWRFRVRFLGWSEPAATNAPVEDEAIQAVLGMNQKPILFPRDFSAPFSAPEVSLPTYLPPLLPTSPLLPSSPHFPLTPS